MRFENGDGTDITTSTGNDLLNPGYT